MIRVLSYPPRHSYVDRLHGTVAELVHRDEPADLPRRSDPDWISDHAAEWDVVHLHLDGAVAELPRLEDVLDAHRDAGRPAVWTIQHLYADGARPPERHMATLLLLAERADVIIAPTFGAAAEFDRCNGRRPRVIPSGGVLTPEVARRWRHASRTTRRSRPRRVLLPAGCERDDLDLRGAIAAARRVAEEGSDVELLVSLDEPRSDQDRSRHEALLELAAPGVRFAVHPPWRTMELCEQIAAADAVLLPYRWCTHCPLTELVTDIGTPVLAGDVGHLGEQAPIVPIRSGVDGIDVTATAHALRRVARDELPGPVPLPSRAVDRRHFLSAHQRLYSALVTSTPPAPSAPAVRATRAGTTPPPAASAADDHDPAERLTAP